MEFHEASGIFPLLGDSELSELASDIALNGLLYGIEVFDGKILDGRNRYRACLQAGVEPRYCEAELGGMSPVEYVVSLNLKRRHLSESQRAMVGARIKKVEAAAAKERKAHGQTAPGKTLPKNSTEASKGDARDLAGRQVNVSGFSVDQAEKVIDKGIPELRALCEGDKLAVSVAARIAEEPKAVQRKAVEAIASGKTGSAAIRQIQSDKHKAAVESVAAIEAKRVEGVFDVIVVDPPWPIEKIEREVRPNQSASLDYPTMTLAEIEGLEIPAADDCWLFCWTTQRFLPATFEIVEGWGFTYSATMVWHKPGGFQPVGCPQYNCEFVVIGRRGSPRFVDTSAFPLCFSAPRGKHSEKPEQFYELLRRVTAGRRLDMFNRRAIEGFERWGKEAE